ncbi:putative TPR repeat methyltransferase [Sphingomonas naasensis]|uniref:Class I SAM-dependent methyltransferase n=1 Tax=Sphingomonas naasensis TaxID=1344951 RepID=A0A4S1W8F2_9SPHN|nr:class I SAM-dependent methyltransferase [Sphingomonas naasensis]NIJ19433.1 putative TPR repeat methyltransferase [Sphingomonas naasensis]TGX39174.1 class I SAM-dependent methyltransferase [Sphingomonas naasensis]
MPDRIAEHYERNAHAFDEARRQNFVEKGWLDRFLLGVPKGGNVLDLGCGAGEPIARYLIDRERQLTGVDVSERMIALARTRFARHHWIRADMRSLELETRFHGVIAWDSLFHLRPEEQAALLIKAADWLEPGGALLFNSGSALDESIGCQFGEELYHASLAPADYRALFAEHGLIEMAFAPHDEAAGGRAIWLARKRG